MPKSKIVQLPQKKCNLLSIIEVAKTIVFDLDETLIHCNEGNDT